MLAYIRSALVVILLVFFAVGLTGCASHTGGRLYESQSWVQRGGSLGKVTLIIAGDIYDPAQERTDVPAKPDRVKEALKTALGQLPGTTILEDIATLPASAPLADRDAIALAKSHGAQSACVVSIATIGSRLTIDLLPPGWSCDTFALYSLRLLDVETGELLASGTTYRHSGGILQFCDWDDYLKGFQRDLAPPKARP